MISDYLSAIYHFLKSAFGRVSSGRLWVLKSVFFCTLISLVFTFPTFVSSFFSCQPNKISYGNELLLKQIEDPFNIHVFDDVPVDTHYSKRVFRLTVPLMAKVLQLDIVGIYILQLVLGIIGLVVFLLLIHRILHERFMSFLALFCLTSLYAGKIWYLQYVVLFDGISIAFLLLTCFTTIPWVSMLFALLAFFNDERSLVGALPVLLVLFFENDEKGKASGYYVLLSIGVYVALRYYMKTFLGMKTPTGFDAGVGLGVLKVNLWGVQNKWLKCYEGFWLIIGLAGFLLWKDRKIYFLLYILTILIVLMSSILIYDVDRSLTYGVGLFVFAFMVLKNNLNADQMAEWVTFSLLISLLIPTNSFIGNFYGSCDANFIGVEIIRMIQAYKCLL